MDPQDLPGEKKKSCQNQNAEVFWGGGDLEKLKHHLGLLQLDSTKETYMFPWKILGIVFI